MPVCVERSTYTQANLNERRRRGPDQYECEFKGNTVLSVGEQEVDPGGRELNACRIFQRQHLRAAQAPMTERADYVHPEKIIRPWLDDLGSSAP